MSDNKISSQVESYFARQQISEALRKSGVSPSDIIATEDKLRTVGDEGANATSIALREVLPSRVIKYISDPKNLL